MCIPSRFAPILFSALLAAIMVCVVSAFVLEISQGIPGLARDAAADGAVSGA